MVWWLRAQRWRAGSEGHDRLQDDGVGQRLRPAGWPLHHARRVAGHPCRTAVRPAHRRRRGRTRHLTPDRPGVVRMAFWNSDGSRADMCGNAALCSTRLSVYLQLHRAGDLRLLTDPAGPGPLSGHGRPGRDPPPGLRSGPGQRHRRVRAELGPGERWMAFATVGVPHLVIRVDDIEAVDLLGRGGSLRSDPRLGAAGANVNFVGAPAGPANPGSSGPTSGAWRERPWRAARGQWRRGSPWPPAGKPRCRYGSGAGGARAPVRAALNGRRASEVWLGGQGKLVFRAVWEV